jgi:hypothetical protein
MPTCGVHECDGLAKFLSFQSWLVCYFQSVSLFAQTDQCVAHFEVSGSIRKGLILETYDDFPEVNVEAAIRRLQAQLPAGVTVVSVDSQNAIVKGGE